MSKRKKKASEPTATEQLEPTATEQLEPTATEQLEPTATEQLEPARLEVEGALSPTLARELLELLPPEPEEPEQPEDKRNPPQAPSAPEAGYLRVTVELPPRLALWARRAAKREGVSVAGLLVGLLRGARARRLTVAPALGYATPQGFFIDERRERLDGDGERTAAAVGDHD